MADLFTGQPIPVEEKVAVVRRELEMRKRVYPVFVSKGRMKQVDADRQIEVMASILADYEHLQASAIRAFSMGSRHG